MTRVAGRLAPVSSSRPDAPMAQTPYKQLEQEWKRLHAFRGAMAILRWDAAVMMPRGSADVRGEQLAALETEYHALVTAPRITRLLDRAQANTGGLEDWQIANLREMRRQRDFAIATPVALVSRLAKAASKAEAKWLHARETGKFEDFAPYLEEVVHLVRDKAQLLGQARNLAPYDALVDEFSPGLTSGEIDAMFKALARRLPGLIREVLARQEQRPVLPIVGKFSAGKQRALAVEIMKAVGFPFDRGRLDESEHPFTEGVPGDVRVTTRFDTTEPFSGLAGRAARNRPCHVRRGPAGGICRSARGPRSRHGAGRKPVAAHGNDRVPQPRLRQLSASRCWKNISASRARVVGRKSLRAPDPRETRPDPRRRRRAHLHAAHPAALRAREPAAVRRARGAQPARRLEFQHGAAARREAAERSRRRAAGRALGRGIVRLLPVLWRWARSWPRSSTRRCAKPCRTSRRRSRAANSPGSWAGCARTCTRHGARVTTQELLKLSTGKPLSAAAALRYLEAKYLEPESVVGSAAA